MILSNQKFVLCMWWFVLNLVYVLFVTEKSKNEEKKLSEEEEEKALSKYLSMDYPKFRRRRPVHNKSLPRSPWSNVYPKFLLIFLARLIDKLR